MYGPFKQLALAVLKAPQDAPHPPAGSHVEVFRASPKYLAYRMLGFWLRIVFVVLVELFFLAGLVVAGDGLASVAGFVVAVAILVSQFFAYFAIRLDWDLRHYIVTDRALRVREGAWIVREMTITHANVQNMRVVQGPIQRLFGFAALEVDTAGGGGAASAKSAHGMQSGHTVRMAGIENAHAVRDRILAHLRDRGGGTGLGDVDDDPEHHAPAAATAPPSLVTALAELRDAARGLRAAAERGTGTLPA